MQTKRTYTMVRDTRNGPVGISADDGLLYEPSFTLPEARRLLKCLRVDDSLTWEQCADYVEGRTEVLPCAN